MCPPLRVLLLLASVPLLGTACGPRSERERGASANAAGRPSGSRVAKSDSEGASLAFDGERAHRDVVSQCAFGPRVPGTEAHRRCFEHLRESFVRLADTVLVQEVAGWIPDRAKGYAEGSTEGRGKRVGLRNLVARFRPDEEKRLLFAAHWDTRPWADRDPDSTRHGDPVLGANDGGSGVAILLEVARSLARKPPPWGVDLVLFDGEDLGLSGSGDFFSQGARGFAANPPVPMPVHAVVLDMVGDRDLRILREENSAARAGATVEWFERRAIVIAPEVFEPVLGPAVYDDHIPLLDAGFPAIDIIDFQYAYWHTVSDLPEAVSAASLARVGRVVLSLIREP